jgi:hypothetical protein
MKIYGTDYGSYQVWRIPNGDGTYANDTFQDINVTSTSMTLLYQGSRVGDYTLASSWANAARGDGGYCGGDTNSDTPSSTTGKVAFWTSKSTNQTGGISVTIDNAYAGVLTKYYSSAPTCGDSGTITKTLSVGSHSYTAKDGSLSWGPASFNISAGGCLTYELQ